MNSPDEIITDELRGGVKSCCAALYGHACAQLLLGPSFHPGGLALTSRLGSQLNLGPASHVLDVASGRGTSALHLARTFGCSVTGIDLSQSNVDGARVLAQSEDLSGRVTFTVGDAEALLFPDAQFDVVICECALCTFPNKVTACSEIARVLKPGGLVGISDVTRQGELPEILAGVLAAAACIADARPVAGYMALLERSGLKIHSVERHDAVLNDLLNQIRVRLLGAEVLAKTNDIELFELNIQTAQVMVRSASEAVKTGRLGYATVIAKKSLASSSDRHRQQTRLPV